MPRASTSFSSMPTRKKLTRSSIATRSICPKSPKSGGAAAWSAPWLLDLTAIGADREDPELQSKFTGYRAGFRRRTLDGYGSRRGSRALRMCSPASLYTRFRSRQDHTFAEKMLSGMRNKFRRPRRARRRRLGCVSEVSCLMWGGMASRSGVVNPAGRLQCSPACIRRW